jgi:hypothetical protein
MLRGKEPSGKVSSGDLLKRTVRELATLREFITFYLQGGSKQNFRPAQLCELAPILLSPPIFERYIMQLSEDGPNSRRPNEPSFIEPSSGQ